MKIAMFTSGYARNPIEDVFRDAKRFGYDGIELWGARPHAYAPDLRNGEINHIKALIEKYEMPVIGYTPEMNAYPFNPMMGNERALKESIDYIKLSMDMAKEMGAGFTLISLGHAGYYTSHSVIWKKAEYVLKELASYGEKIKHKIVLEPLTPYESNVITTANDLKEALDMVPSEYLLGMCDVVPPYVQHEPVLSYFNKLGNKMYHMHIIDSDGSSDSHIMPGEGNMPLFELMSELKDLNYKGFLTIELVTGYINEPSLYALRAIKNLRSMFNGH